MNTPELSVKRREGTGKGIARRLRREGVVPAILYGGAAPQTITVNPRDVLRIIALSRATYRKMIQNLWWAAGYNIIAIPLAAGLLAGYGFVLSPAIGAVLMSASTVVVAINAQLLRRARV